MHKIYSSEVLSDDEFKDINDITVEYIALGLNLPYNLQNVHILDSCICSNIELTLEVLECMRDDTRDLSEWIKCEDKRDDCNFAEVFGKMNGFMGLLNKVKE